MAIISTKVHDLPLAQDPTQFEIPGFDITTNAGAKSLMSNLKGEKGDNGEGVPLGGKTGEFLSKNSNNDFDTIWQSPLRPLFIRAGAVYNATTGFYELNGLTDITEAQMIDIYTETASKRAAAICPLLFSRTTARTNFSFNTDGGAVAVTDRNMIAFASNSNFEVFALRGNFMLGNKVAYMFENANKLHTISGVMTWSPGTTNTSAMFTATIALANIQITGLSNNLRFNSTALTRDSIMYMVNNSGNGSTVITLTVSATAYARLTSDDLAVASARNINIASV